MGQKFFFMNYIIPKAKAENSTIAQQRKKKWKNSILTSLFTEEWY